MNKTEELYEKIRDMAENVSNLYDDQLKSDLSEVEEVLESKIGEVVKEHASNYNLHFQNDSSKEICLYELSGRVKEKESLREKIVWDQLYFDLINAANDKEKLSILVNKMDDLIGLRYLVSLSHDCEEMHRLIAENIKEFNAIGITFNNIDNNPQIMRNGRKIYRLKGEFQSYKFELQIKSKIDSAWADIEHMLFYKDFNFSYIQGTNKEVMNKIGDLLEEIDGLMLKVRDSQIEYEKHVEDMDFSQYLRKRHVDLVRKKLGSSHILTEYRSSIFRMFTNLSPETRDRVMASKDNPKENNIVEFQYDRECESSIIYVNYLKLKNQSIELSVFESLYYEWKACERKEYLPICHKELEGFLKELIKCIVTDYHYDYSNFSDWFVEGIMEILLEKVINEPACCFVFNKSKIDMLYSYWVASYIEMADKWENVEDSDEDPQVRSELETIFYEFFLRRNPDIDEFRSKIKEVIREQENDEITSFIYNELIECINNVYAKDPNNSSGKTKPRNVLTILLENGSIEKE